MGHELKFDQKLYKHLFYSEIIKSILQVGCLAHGDTCVVSIRDRSDYTLRTTVSLQFIPRTSDIRFILT